VRRQVRKKWRNTLRALRAECKPLLPVRVLLRPGPQPYYGYARLNRDRKGFLIVVYKTIDSGFEGIRAQTAGELADTLIHEWAHVLAWSGLTHESFGAHDAEWGVAYSRCYQAVVED